MKKEIKLSNGIHLLLENSLYNKECNINPTSSIYTRREPLESIFTLRIRLLLIMVSYGEPWWLHCNLTSLTRAYLANGRVPSGWLNHFDHSGGFDMKTRMKLVYEYRTL